MLTHAHLHTPAHPGHALGPSAAGPPQPSTMTAEPLSPSGGLYGPCEHEVPSVSRKQHPDLDPMPGVNPALGHGGGQSRCRSGFTAGLWFLAAQAFADFREAQVTNR